MKRDMSLARMILLELEKSEMGRYGNGELKLPEIDGYQEATIKHHCYLLYQAGLLEGVEGRSRGETRDGPMIYPLWLTWKGHDFVDAVRIDTLWNRAMEKIKDKIESASFDLLFEFTTALGKSILFAGESLSG